MPASQWKKNGKPAIDLLEEAVHLLRQLPLGTWVVYYTGTLPFVLGMLYFWSDMCRGAFAREHLVAHSLVLALLFVWMKTWQAAACSQMETHITGAPDPRWTVGRAARCAVTQAALQPVALLALPLAALVTLPFAWVTAYFQNVVALARGESLQPRDVSRPARELAQLWPLQNHVALSVLAVFGLFVWINVAVALLAAPFFLRTFLGIETDFSRSALSMLNTTFLASVCGGAYLVLDPLLKAFYTLRCFYGQALRSGQDLRVELRRLKTAALLVCCALLFHPAARAAEPIDHERLERSIQETLDRPEFSWRLPREVSSEEKGWLSSFVSEIIDGARRLLLQLKEPLEKFFEWLGRWLKPKRPLPSGEPFDFIAWIRAAENVVYLLSGLALLLAAVLLWKRWRLTRAPVAAVAVAVAARPDLAAEETIASQLPEDEWLRLADEMIARREYRLAFRAYFLAGLAHLGARGLVTVARHKSNREYERELGRRARREPEKRRALGENVAAFERVWYGRHPARPEDLPAFSGNLEELRRP